MLFLPPPKYEKELWIAIPSVKILFWRGSQQERQLLTVLILLLLLAVPLFLQNIKVSKVAGSIEGAQLLASAAGSQAFSLISLEAEAAYVFDIESGDVLYGKNEDKILPLASLTKIMTALVALETLSAEAEIEISKEALGQKGDNGLYFNEKWQLSELVKFMLIASSNDAAYAIANSDPNSRIYRAAGIAFGDAQPSTSNFIDRMNQKAVELDLRDTIFFNETGLDEYRCEPANVCESTNGGYGTAREVARLFVYAVKKYPGILKATARENITLASLSGFDHYLKNTNTLTSSVYNIIASKTGLTILAGGNLTVVFDAHLGRPVVAIVLGSTEEGRFSDIEKLITASVAFINGE